VRKVTDALDAWQHDEGRHQGYAIGSAGLAALVLFADYTSNLEIAGKLQEFSLSDPAVIIGLFIAVSCLSLRRHGDGSRGPRRGLVVVEVRRQFKEIPGIMEGTGKPDYSKAVDMLTRAAIKEMIVRRCCDPDPGGRRFGMNLLLAPRRHPRARRRADRHDRHGPVRRHLDVHAAVPGQRQEVHRGRQLRRKGSETHKAAVTGDTVGDPYKDTAGRPSTADQDHQHRGAAAGAAAVGSDQ